MGALGDSLSAGISARQPLPLRPSGRSRRHGEFAYLCGLHVPHCVPYRGAMNGPRFDRWMERLTWILGALIALALFGCHSVS